MEHHLQSCHRVTCHNYATIVDRPQHMKKLSNERYRLMKVGGSKQYGIYRHIDISMFHYMCILTLPGIVFFYKWFSCYDEYHWH